MKSIADVVMHPDTLKGVWRIAASLALVGALVLETSTESVVLARAFESDSPLPLHLVFLICTALLSVILVLTMRGLDLPRRIEELAPLPAMPRLDLALTIGCLAAILILANNALGLPYDGPGLSKPLDNKLLDTFHEGELAGGFVLNASDSGLPVMIHGPGRNLLPGVLAEMFAEPGYGMVFIRFVEASAHSLTILLIGVATIVSVLAVLPRSAPRRERWMLASAAGLGAMLFGTSFDHLSSRFLFFLAVLALTVGWVAQAERTQGRAKALGFALGVVAALALLYVYNAALQSGLVIAAGGALVLLRHRLAALSSCLMGVLGFALTVGAISAIDGGALYGRVAEDVLYWLTAGRGIWELPSQSMIVVIGVVLVVCFLAFSIAFAWLSSKREAYSSHHNSSVYWVLAIALFASSTSMWERSDVQHVLMAFVAVSVVLGVLGAHLLRAIGTSWPALSRLAVAGLAVGSLGIGLSGVGGPTIRESVAALKTPDSAILPADVLDLAERYEATLSQQDCLLVLSNNGIINYAVKLPPCGGVYYPVYWATPEGDARLAAWLEANRQLMVVTSGTDPSYMRSRLPLTHAFIDRTMPVKETVGGHVVNLVPNRL